MKTITRVIIVTIISTCTSSLLFSQTGTIKPIWSVKVANGEVYSISFSPDGSNLIAGIGSTPETVRILNTSIGKFIKEINTERPWFTPFSPDGEFIASGGYNTLILHQSKSGKVLWRMRVDQSYSMRSLAFSPDSSLIACSGLDNLIKIFNVKTGKFEKEFPIEGFGWLTAFSPDGRYLAAGGNPDITVYELGKNDNPFIVKAYPENKRNQSNIDTLSMTFSADSTLLATAGLDSIVRLWDVKTGNLVREFDKIRCGIHAMDMSHDGKLIATADCDEVVILDTDSGSVKLRIPVKKGFIKGISFSPDGKSIALCTRENIIEMWQLIKP